MIIVLVVNVRVRTNSAIGFEANAFFSCKLHGGVRPHFVVNVLLVIMFV